MLIFGILEDDPARQRVFERVSRELGAQVSIHDNALDFQAWVKTSLASASLLSLDGDLFGSSKSDPGSGLDVAQFLCNSKPPCAPVMVHSANRGLARKMVEVLHLEGWEVIAVDPAPGDGLDQPLDSTQWIEKSWRECAQRLACHKPDERHRGLSGIRVVHALVVLLFLGMTCWLYARGLEFALKAWGLVGGTTAVLMTSLLMARASWSSSSRQVRIKGYLQALGGIGLIVALWTWFALHRRAAP